MNLREAREQLGLSQTDLSVKTGIPSTYLSQQESGVKDLGLEDMILCEAELGMQIDWTERFSSDERIVALRAFITLAERFPLVAILDLAKRILSDRRDKAPVKKLAFYAQASTKSHEGLYPLGMGD